MGVDMKGDERVDLAAEAFIYGFPLVFDLQEVDRFVRAGMGAAPASPFNRFGHASALAGPEERFVSINNDTIYSVAQVDLSGGPLRLDVPDTAGRYYVLQFIDAWTNNFAYLGHRSTGTQAGSYLLAPPGDLDEGDGIIRFPTEVGTILGRWAVDGDDDLPIVRNLQAGLNLSPETDGIARGLPVASPSVAEDLLFFEQLRVWIQAYPPSARDLDYQQRFEPLGLFQQDSPYADPDAEFARTLQAGIQKGRARLEQALRNSPAPRQNGWNLTYHVFDYNLDFFEVGALNDPAWKTDLEPVARYLLRAGAARGGLWGNHGYEAAYAMTYEDGNGTQLNGRHRYTLRFDQTPPVGAFWSVTMYDTPDFYLVANPINRYSIGNRTRGLHTAEDGSLTIVMQTDEPSQADERANWLPTPVGDFRPLLRMYEPHTSVLDGRYVLPPITRHVVTMV
jgi:hypothetical protein